MSKHTPGPWCNGNSDASYGVFTETGECRTIAYTAFNKNSRTPEAAANAKLIAAAPDLLAACQLAMQFWYSDQPNDTPESVAAKHAIRDAINKATKERRFFLTGGSS